jgi:uncharacterized protein (DUF433 family)
MSRVRWQDGVVVDNDLHHGDLCIKGTRVPVGLIVGSLADGVTHDQIRQALPQLTGNDISAALACAAEALNPNLLTGLPVPAWWSMAGAADF